MKKNCNIKVAKVDEDLGIVFGYAIVCKKDGDPYFDRQGDHIPEDVMLKSVMKYMEGDRVAKVMHDGDATGQIVFGFPLTEDIAEALGIECEKTGFIIGMRPDDDEILEKFADGSFSGFSIGGKINRKAVP